MAELRMELEKARQEASLASAASLASSAAAEEAAAERDAALTSVADLEGRLRKVSGELSEVQGAARGGARRTNGAAGAEPGAPRAVEPQGPQRLADGGDRRDAAAVAVGAAAVADAREEAAEAPRSGARRSASCRRRRPTSRRATPA